MKTKLQVPHISGIDALYYFAQSGAYYKEFYQDIVNQVDNKRKMFESLNYAYQDNEIVITLNNINIKYSGKGRDGFSWFGHDFFRIGFKEQGKNANIHDIRVQLNAIGIYTLGITSLLEYINKKLLDGAILEDNYFPVTRIDVNMFVQHNFNYLHKEMIVSKKKIHAAQLGERSSGYELETYYVGKKPFLLRIYNKLKELTTASTTKKELMYNYFGVHGLDVNKSIFNVEFEMHREFLKQYGIDTIEDALQRSQKLFELGCDLVKLIDTTSITEKQLNTSNRRRADTLPVWEFISNNYNNKEFMQITTPLSKIDKITYNYSLEDAKKSIKRVVKRLQIHSSSPTLFFFLDILQESKEEFALQQEIEDMCDENSSSQSKKIKEDLSSYSNEGLLRYEESLALAMRNEEYESKDYNELSTLYQNVNNELEARELLDIPF